MQQIRFIGLFAQNDVVNLFCQLLGQFSPCVIGNIFQGVIVLSYGVDIGDSFLVWEELPFFEKTCSGDLNIAELNLGGSGMMGGLWIMMGVPPTTMETMANFLKI